MKSNNGKVTHRGQILEAQKLITGVAHDARNEFSNYDYTSSEAMIRAAGTACQKVGVLIRRTSWTYEKTSEFGGDVTSEFEVSCPESDDPPETFSLNWPAVIGKGKPWDKAIATALTTSWAYWVRDLLAIPRAEDGGMDTRDDSEYTPPAAKKRPAKPRNPPKAATLPTLDKIRKAESAEHFMRGVAWLDQQFADKLFTLPQFSAILLESYKHGLTLATNDEERDVVLESLGKHKEPMGTVNYEAALDAARQLTTPKETNDAVDDHEWPAKAEPANETEGQ